MLCLGPTRSRADPSCCPCNTRQSPVSWVLLGPWWLQLNHLPLLRMVAVVLGSAVLLPQLGGETTLHGEANLRLNAGVCFAASSPLRLMQTLSAYSAITSSKPYHFPGTW